jgi:hypothetical protein
MDDLEYPAGSFDAIYSIDADFFSSDLPNLLQKLKHMLKENGKFVTFHEGYRSSENESIDVLAPQNTQIGQACKKAELDYETFDCTDAFYQLMLLKRKTAPALKEEFIAEGNEYLFDYVFGNQYQKIRACRACGKRSNVSHLSNRYQSFHVENNGFYQML